MQMSFSRFVQKDLAHFRHVVLRSKPLSFEVTRPNVFSPLGKFMAFLEHSGSHAVQPLTHLCGWATKAFPSRNSRTPFGQNSTQRGFPNDAHPSHFSGKIVGYHTPHTLVINFHFSSSLLQSKHFSVSNLVRKDLSFLHFGLYKHSSLIGVTVLSISNVD